jgi:hypothetical protein
MPDPAVSSSSVFDRLRRSKYGYVATGWARFIDNLSRPENAEIAEIIKNDQDFFARSEAVYAAKDIGKLRRAIKSAIGRAGAVAYMEKGKIERDGIHKPEWDWRDFTSKLIDTGLSIPKEERHMWVLNCNNNSLKKGEKIKLPGTKEEYEVLEVKFGEAKITGPLGRISAKSEVLVWRPGSQFSEKVSDRPDAGPALKVDAETSSTRTRTNQKVESSSQKGRGEQDMANKKAATSAWQQNDGEVDFGFGMLVRRGKLTGKVIRAHGNKLRVRLDDEGGTVEWNADDESIYWRDAAAAGSADDGGKKGQAVSGKATGGKPAATTARKPAKDESEEEEDDEEEEIEEEEEPAEQEEDDEDDEIDPDDLPDSDDDLLDDEDESQEDEEDEQDEEEDDDPEEDQEEEEQEEQPAGEQQSEFIYTGNDIAELAGTDYQRVQKLKSQGVLDGTFVQTSNGRIMYSFDAVELVKNAPKNKPGRPPGGGKKKTAAATATPRTAPATAPEKADKPRPGAPLFTPLVRPSQPSEKGTRQTATEAPSPRPASPAASPVSTPSKSTAVPKPKPLYSFADTIGQLEAEIERRENELDRLREALQTLKTL